MGKSMNSTRNDLLKRIEYLEHKKSEVVAEHVRIYHDTELNKADKIVLATLDCEIQFLKEKGGLK